MKKSKKNGSGNSVLSATYLQLLALNRKESKVEDRMHWQRTLEKNFRIGRSAAGLDKCSCKYHAGSMQIDGGCKYHAPKIVEVNLYSKQRKLRALWRV